MVARRRAGLGALAAALAAAAAPRVAAAHPIHSSVAELTYDPAGRAVQVLLRVFADDFSADVARRTGARLGPGGLPPDDALYRYVAARFAVAPAAGPALAFRPCGVRQVGVQLFVCLRAPAAAPPAGLRVRSAILSDVFADQVNIVQASVGARRQTLLFTPGDGFKPL